jgi:Transposase and inactivated derivatives
MSRRKISPEEKLRAVQEYLDGKGSMETIAARYGITYTPFRTWLAKYKAFGSKAFIRTGHNALYSAAFKIKVVNAYLNGEGSYEELSIKYKIPTGYTVRCWVLKYNGHEELKTSRMGGYFIMTKSRKTTFDERVEIVQHCISHNHNYSETAQKYKVSYQQARNYTIKYETGGVEALKDNRGKRKAREEMTELERLRAENKILRAEKERAEMEARFLKKLEEIEGRRY